MNVTFQQYNTVINGLRVQLELQRDLANEKIKEIDLLTQQAQTNSVDIENYKKLINTHSKLMQRYDNLERLLEIHVPKKYMERVLKEFRQIQT